MTRLNVNNARCAALFALGLQRSDAPAADAVAEVISRTVRQVVAELPRHHDPPPAGGQPGAPTHKPTGPDRPGRRPRSAIQGRPDI
jgi:hypothetical protein